MSLSNTLSFSAALQGIATETQRQFSNQALTRMQEDQPTVVPTTSTMLRPGQGQKKELNKAARPFKRLQAGQSKYF